MPENLEKRNGVWQFRAMIGGKLHRRTTGFSDLARARRRATEIENDIRAGRLGWNKPEPPQFSAWADRFLEAYYPEKYTERILLKRAIDRWGSRPLNLVLPSDIQEYFKGRLAEGAAGATLERERLLLKSMYRAAIADKSIEESPMETIRTFKRNVRTRVLTREQEVELRKTLKPTWDRYLTVALGTGLRAGEQRMARPMDLRHGGKWLWVRPESNKTRKAREVPLTAAVLKALQEQQASREGDETVPFWPVIATTAKTHFLRVCKRAKIDPVTPHDFRRTFGTRWAERKGYPKHLQLIMGHENINTTLKYYVHLEATSVHDTMMEIFGE